jgi:hypothetical protein
MDTAAILTVYRFAHLTLERNLLATRCTRCLASTGPGSPLYRAASPLRQVTSDRMAERASETMTVAEQLGFLGFHEAYPVGQADLSRRLLGKAGAIA